MDEKKGLMKQAVEVSVLNTSYQKSEIAKKEDTKSDKKE